MLTGGDRMTKIDESDIQWGSGLPGVTMVWWWMARHQDVLLTLGSSCRHGLI